MRGGVGAMLLFLMIENSLVFVCFLSLLHHTIRMVGVDNFDWRCISLYPTIAEDSPGRLWPVWVRIAGQSGPGVKRASQSFGNLTRDPALKLKPLQILQKWQSTVFLGSEWLKTTAWVENPNWKIGWFCLMTRYLHQGKGYIGTRGWYIISKSTVRNWLHIVVMFSNSKKQYSLFRV